MSVGATVWACNLCALGSSSLRSVGIAIVHSGAAGGALHPESVAQVYWRRNQATIRIVGIFICIVGIVVLSWLYACLNEQSWQNMPNFAGTALATIAFIGAILPCVVEAVVWLFMPENFTSSLESLSLISEMQATTVWSMTGGTILVQATLALGSSLFF